MSKVVPLPGVEEPAITNVNVSQPAPPVIHVHAAPQTHQPAPVVMAHQPVVAQVIPQQATIQQQMITTVTPSAVVPSAMARYGNFPVKVKCYSCHHEAFTRLEYISGAGNWLGCGCCCLFGCWLGCQAIPFCMDSLKDINHHCGNCGLVLGRKSAL